jgi:hypothetical protein
VGAVERVARQAATGAIAGTLATGAMSVAMIAAQRLLPLHERYPLPPRLLVSRLTRWIGVRRDMNRTDVNALTPLAHFGYGASAGALNGPRAARIPARAPPAARGIVYGLRVWAGRYIGLLPALGILRPATQHPAARIGAAVGWRSASWSIPRGLSRAHSTIR